MRIETKDGYSGRIYLNSELPFVNLIRRTMMSSIPTCRFTNIQIRNNSSIYDNYFIKSRLGLIPINQEKLKKHKQYTFKIKKENNDKKEYHITCDDIEIYDEKNEKVDIWPFKRDPITKDSILVLTLYPKKHEDEKVPFLEVIMNVGLNIGKKHISYSPIETISYKKVNNEYEIQVESLGMLNIKELFSQTIQILIQKLNKFKEFSNTATKNTTNYVYTIKPFCRFRENMLNIKNYDDFGIINLISHMAMKHKHVKHSGCDIVHPLHKQYRLNITTHDNSFTTKQILDIIHTCVDRSITILKKI